MMISRLHEEGTDDTDTVPFSIWGVWYDRQPDGVYQEGADIRLRQTPRRYNPSKDPGVDVPRGPSLLGLDPTALRVGQWWVPAFLNP